MCLIEGVKNWVLSNDLVKVKYNHCKRFRKLTFQALALLTFTLMKGLCSKCQVSKSFTVVVTQPLPSRLIKPNFSFTLPLRHSTTVSLETRNNNYSFIEVSTDIATNTSGDMWTGYGSASGPCTVGTQHLPFIGR